MSELGPQLREYFDTEGPPIDVRDLLDRAPTRGHRPRGFRLAVAVAAAVVLVGGGMLVWNLFADLGRAPVIAPVPGDAEPGEDPAEPPAEPPTSPAGEAFAEPGSWTVETSLGPWTWTWMPESDEARDRWQQAAVSTGMDQDVLAQLQLVELSEPDVADMIWTGPELLPWERIPWARSGETTVILHEAKGRVDWDALLGRETCTEWRDGFTTLVLLDPDGPSEGCWSLDQDTDPIVTLSVHLAEDGAGAVEFRDREADTLVLRLEATDPDISAEQLGPVGQGSGGDGFPAPSVVWTLVVDDGDGVRSIDAPWQGLPVALLDVAAGPDGFVAVAVGPADWPAGDRTPLLYRWASPDGVDWDSLASPLRLPLDREVTQLQLVAGGAGLLVRVHDDGEQTSLWRSDDGVDWQRVGPELDGTTPSHLSWAEFGWLVTDERQEPPAGNCEVWVSPDGVRWEQVPFQPEVEPRRDPQDGLYCEAITDGGVHARLHVSSGPDRTQPAPPGCQLPELRELENGDEVHDPGGCGLWIGWLDG